MRRTQFIEDIKKDYNGLLVRRLDTQSRRKALENQVKVVGKFKKSWKRSCMSHIILLYVHIKFLM